MAEVLSRKSSLPASERTQWQCSRCTSFNNDADMDCRVCLEAKPGRPQLGNHLREEQDRLPEEGPVKKSFVDNVKSLFLGKPVPWQCPRCTCTMGGFYTKCSACGYLRTDSRRRSDSLLPDFLTKLTRRQNSRPQQASSVDIDGDSGFQEGSGQPAGWSCPRCTLRNSEKARACKACDWRKTVPKQVLSFVEDSYEVIDSSNESLTDALGGLWGKEGTCSTFAVTDDGSPTQILEPTDPTRLNSMVEQSVLVLPTSPKHTSLPSPAPATPRPHSDHAPPASLDVSQRALISSPTARSWKCSVCGAFNLIFAQNQKCYVCGIGLIPHLINDDVAAAAVANNRTHRVHPVSLVVPSNPVPRPEGYGQLVYTKHPSALVTPHPIRGHGGGGAIGLPDTGPTKPPERPTTLDIKVRKDQSQMAAGRRRRNSSIRRSAEDSLGTPAQNTTQLLRVVKHKYEVEADRIYQEICQYCRTSKEPFTDPDFPPADISLYKDIKKPVARWRIYQWQRPENVFDPHSSRTTKWVVLRNPGPEDIAQGVLGNCWVLSALAVIAECPKLIEDIMLTREYSPKVGAYQVRLCKDGKWEVVVIDDCLPVYRNGELVFSKAHHKQLWVPLIEKALAKLYGSYEALNAGKILSGLSILTGLPCEKIYLKKQCPDDDGIDYDLIWAQLLSFRESKFPMGASCGGFGINEQDYYNVGLEPNHAYSILDVRQLDLGEGSRKLLRLRNPWRKCSWNGNWSDRDPIWQSTPQLRTELRPLGADEGIFWIEFEDFMNYFCEVDLCKHRPDWFSTRTEGRLPARALSRYDLLAFDVTVTTEVDISIYQPSLRGNDSRNHNDLAVLVLKYPFSHQSLEGSIPLPESCAIASGSQIQSIVTTSGFLDPGKYAILPLAFNHWLQHSEAPPTRKDARSRGDGRGGVSDDDGVPYVVALHTGREVFYREHVTTRPGFLAESLFLLAKMKNGKKSNPFPDFSLYEVSLPHACRIIIGENRHHHNHFTVTCDAHPSSNIVTTRGELLTVDCLPPMHRQVIAVVTQLEGSQPYAIYMKIEVHKSPYNSAGGWGATHYPVLTPEIEELHQPRLIN